MKITIKTISGKVYQLEDVEADLTVDKLKLLTEKHTEIEPDCQRLIFKGKVLKNEQTLADAKLSDGDCIIVVKSRKKKKRQSSEEKKEARNAPQASANANAAPPPAQASSLPNGNQQAFGFMMGQGQPPMPLNFDALNALFQRNAQANPVGVQQPAAANAAQQPAAASNNANAPPPAANPFAAMMGMGQGANQMPDLNAIMQMMQNPMVQQMLRNPAMQQMLQDMMRNPQMLQNLMRNNPMMNGLLQGFGNFPAPAAAPAQAAAAPPPAAAAAAAPQAAAAAPNAAPAAQQEANNPANANAVPNAQPAANANAQAAPAAANPQAAAQPNPLGFLLGLQNNQQPNPLLAYLNANQMRQPVRQPQGINDAQAREMYAAQLQQLQNMGFLDEARNLRALRETAGSVEAAINMLLR